jgi:hypothetical protein
LERGILGQGSFPSVVNWKSDSDAKTLGPTKPFPVFLLVMLARCPRRLLFLLSLVLVVGTPVSPATAQPTSLDCTTRTATNASIILPEDLEIVLNDTAQEGPWRIAVFTSDGHCTGTARWSNEATVLTAWGSPPATAEDVLPSNTALAPNDTMHIHLLNPRTDTEYPPKGNRITVSFQSDAPHLRTSPIYVPNGIYVVDRIAVQTSLITQQE